MSRKTWKLTDTAAGISIDEIVILPENVGGPAGGYSVTKHTLRGGMSQGVEAIRIVNGALTLVVLPTRGMGIWRAWSDRFEIGWRSPVRGPVHPSLVPLDAPDGLGWNVGFDELVTRHGLAAGGEPEFSADGRLLYPLNGHIQNIPADDVELVIDGESGEIELSGVVDEVRFGGIHLRLTARIKTQVGLSGFEIHDSVENLRGAATDMQLQYGIHLGPPVLREGSRLVAAARAVVPRNTEAAAESERWNVARGHCDGTAGRTYFIDPAIGADDMTGLLLKSPDSRMGIGLGWEAQRLPCVTFTRHEGAPGDGYLASLCPGIHFSNTFSFEKLNERVIRIEPGGRFDAGWGLRLYGTIEEVVAAEEHLHALGSGADPVIYDTPQPGWSELA